MPTDRYRFYHVEKAKDGIGMTMTPGSAIVAEDSPAASGNLHVKDEIVPWLRRLTEDCHEHDCAVIIQLTHLGRRTNWNRSGRLPMASASRVREPAHRAFPEAAEEWAGVGVYLKTIVPAARESFPAFRESWHGAGDLPRTGSGDLSRIRRHRQAGRQACAAMTGRG